jgi:hypothetical protein
MNRHKGTSDWLAVVNLPTLVLCALVIVPDVGWSASNFPACPVWTHNLMFVNAGNSTVHVKETPGCFANSIGQPPFNGARCWPLQAGGGFDLKPGAANAVTVKMTSCWSGNFGIACASCKSGVQTLAEFTFDGGLDATAKKLPGLLDTYDVSLVDGFTKALSIAPNNNVKAGGGTCSSAGCKTPPVCPGKLVDGDACLSPNQYVAAHAGDFSDTDRKKYGCVCSVTESGACSDNANHEVPAVCVGQFGCSPFSKPVNLTWARPVAPSSMTLARNAALRRKTVLGISGRSITFKPSTRTVRESTRGSMTTNMEHSLAKGTVKRP